MEICKAIVRQYISQGIGQLSSGKVEHQEGGALGRWTMGKVEHQEGGAPGRWSMGKVEHLQLLTCSANRHLIKYIDHCSLDRPEFRLAMATSLSQ